MDDLPDSLEIDRVEEAQVLNSGTTRFKSTPTFTSYKNFGCVTTLFLLVQAGMTST